MTDTFHARPRVLGTRDRFIGETGLVFESLHLPRIAGQIFGALLLAPADGYTAQDLVDMLQVSKGSVSGMTRLLMHYEMVTRISLPGDRRDRFVIKPGASAELMLGRMALLGQLQELASEGLGLLGPNGDPAPLEEVRDMYAFLQRELPRLMERWEAERRIARQTAHTAAQRAAQNGTAQNGSALHEHALLESTPREEVRP